MHRFRKKSDAKKPFAPYPSAFHAQPIPAQPPIVSDVLPQLPSSSDFRTSLILPDLSRRFSVLRSSSGEPVSVDALRLKFAQQRARGAENQVSEEEEDMIFESLGFRARAATPSKSQENVSDAGAGASTSSIHSSTPSSPASRSTKRYSNNLFGSGKFRDYTYVRNASSKASSRVQSSASTDTSPHTPSYDSNNTDPFATHPAPLTAPTSFGDRLSPQPSVGLPKALGKAAYKRASLALEQAINEIEEEDEEGPEDEVVLPRSAPIMRDYRLSPDPVRSMNPSSFEASGMAISSDKHIRSDSDDRRASPVPSKTLPGYIPGMPRPMTPREMDSGDEQRSYSTTPRATSPTMLPNRLDSSSPSFSTSVMSNFMRPDTASPPASVRQSPVPMAPYATTPLFLQRSPNGRYTPEEPRSMSSEIAIDFDQSLNASILGRRRAASPLSSAGHSGSRPGTPSSAAMVWPQPPSSPIRHTHNRNGSWFSDGGSAEVTDHSNGNNGKGSGLRSLKSPALPDSPLIDRGHSTVDSISSLYSQPDKRPTSPMSIMELSGSTVVGSRIVRSPTPSHDAPRSPTSATFTNGASPRSVRSSKQHVASTQFNFDSLQPLVFSPLANSSRSSLESAGSSYHSWQGDRKEGLDSLFNDNEAQQSAWYDVYVSDQSSSITPGASSLDDDAEAILQAVGLHKSDFLTIQEKLVQVASSKTTSSDTPNRAPSLRRRRPSTSQSTYSHNGRITSSSPLPHTPQNSGFMPTLDTTKKDVVESSDESSPTRKNKAIAHLLFGQEEAEPTPPPQADPSPYDNEITFTSFSFPKELTLTSPPPLTPPMSATSASGPYSLPRNPSMPKLPQTPQEEAELTREVERRTTEAMLALKGASHSQSNLNVNAHLGHSPSASRKRISPHQISTPTLVSASTSVDTIPLRSPVIPISTGSTKMSRFKKLRGTLRKPTNLPTGEEVTPFPLDLHSPTSPGMRHNQEGFTATASSDAVPIPTSAVEPRFKITVPSPPASAGPGLKGFMARFRSKPRTIDPSLQYAARHSPQPSATSSTPRENGNVGLPRAPQGKLAPSGTSPPTRVPVYHTADDSTYSSSLGSPTTPRGPHAPLPPQESEPDTPVPMADENLALRQLYTAAQNLGIDEKRLNDLVRSTSTSSKSTTWTSTLGRNTSTRDTLTSSSSPQSTLSRNNSISLSQAATNLKHNNSSMVADQPDAHVEAKARQGSDVVFTQSAVTTAPVRSLSMRKPIPDQIRRPREGVDKSAYNSAVIRRTIVMPSEFRNSSAFDINALLNAKASSNRRRVSTTSTSSRSVQDRVPTPPPARSSRRFSRDREILPPVPQLPGASGSGADGRLKAPGLEPSNSNYDSLFDMYTGDGKAQTGERSHGTQHDLPIESNQIIEVLELANGNTVWSVVNGLRDDDTESMYGGRMSMSSEYDDRDEEMAIYVKEHQRGESTSSSYRQHSQPVPRPETKVFYSSAVKIGRLIENLSHDMEAGSFNFRANTQPLYSSTSSMSPSDTDGTWTVEERLDHMLGKMGA